MSVNVFCNPYTYSDDLVTATELNRQPGQVLDKALNRPVTITRNDQYFALLSRERATSLAKAAMYGRNVFELLNVAFRLRLGEKIGIEHPNGWLAVFDQDDLQEFIEEITEAYRQTSFCDQAWDELDAIIHEWHESALAIASPKVAAAFSDEFDELPLTQPVTDSIT